MGFVLEIIGEELIETGESCGWPFGAKAMVSALVFVKSIIWAAGHGGVKFLALGKRNNNIRGAVAVLERHGYFWGEINRRRNAEKMGIVSWKIRLRSDRIEAED